MEENFFAFSFWGSKLQESYTQFKAGFLNYMPNIFAAAAVLIIGWLLAKIARYLGGKLGSMLFSLSSIFEKQLNVKTTKDRRKFSSALGAIFYWIVLVYFIFFALKILNFPGVNLWTSQLFVLMPTVISSIAIIFIGFLLGTIAKQGIYSSFSHREGSEPYFIAQSVRFGIVTIFTIWGLGQIGINIAILTNFISIIFAAIFGAAALGFGLGSSSHVASLIAAYNLKKNFNVGEKIKIDNMVGTITNITNTTMILETEDGVMVVPAKLTNEIISCKAL